MKPSELIAKEENWCKGGMARNINNVETFTNDPSAVKFCIAGAIYKCSDSSEYVGKLFKLKDSLKIITGIPTWNDAPERTHKEVIDALVAIGE